MTVTTLSARQVRLFLLERYAEPLAKRGIASDRLPDDLDLLKEGIIDSLGILDMITSLEDRFGISVDFENLDAERLTHVGALCRYIEASCKSNDL